MCAGQNGLQYKKKVYMRKLSKREKETNNLEHSLEYAPRTNMEDEDQSGNTQPNSNHIPNSDPIFELDKTSEMLIALRKDTRTSTKYPMYNFLSYQSLFPSFQAFTLKLSCVVIPKNIQEALEVPKWREIVLEEMRALEKNETWEMVDPLKKRLQLDASEYSQ